MLKYHNDGKGKWNSHEVWVDNGIGSIFNNIGKGYGENFEVALEYYKRILEEAIQEIKSVDFDREEAVKVNWMGKPIIK